MANEQQTNFPKVSILVPVFNVEQYLRQCLDSILEQSYKNIEIICVNDCSNDNSLAILKEYAQKDERIIIIDKRVNEGASEARKTALTQSSGEYILPIDSDDWIEPNMIEELYCCLSSGGHDMVCCGYFQEKPDGAYYDPPQVLSEDKAERIKFGIFGFGNAKVLWNKLVKREIYEKVKFSKESNGEDCYISCQNFYHSDRVGCYSLPLYHYRYSKDSLTENKSLAQKRYEERKANYGHIIEFCKEKFGEDLSLFEPELSIRMRFIEKQNPAYRRKKYGLKFQGF
jgi:glycosyltransferase involved in cell wall biosynthesis